MKIQTPCKNCIDRELNCHSKCQKYLEYKKDLETQKEIEKKNRHLDGALLDFKITRIQAMKRSRK